MNIGPLSLTSVIMTNSSEGTENFPSAALMRRVTSLLFSRSRIPITVIFPDEGSIENVAAYSLGNKEYVMMELLPQSASVAFTWNMTVPGGVFSSTEMLFLYFKEKKALRITPKI